jgi:hypothetical protein
VSYISNEDAERILKEETEGSFVIHFSLSSSEDVCVSVKSKGVVAHHMLGYNQKRKLADEIASCSAWPLVSILRHVVSQERGEGTFVSFPKMEMLKKLVSGRSSVG